MPRSSSTAAHTANLIGALGTVARDLVDAALLEELGRGSDSFAAAVLTLGTRAHASIDALARTLGLSHSATVRLVDDLVRSGLVRRRPGDDGRSTGLTLTRTGASLFGRLTARRQAALESLLSGVPAGTVARLRTILIDLLDGVAGTRDEARRFCRFCDHARCQPCPVGCLADGERPTASG